MAVDTKSGPASSNYTMQMPFRSFNTARVVSLQLVRRLSPGTHAHLWRPGGEGLGVICSFIHVDISSFFIFSSRFVFPFSPPLLIYNLRSQRNVTSLIVQRHMWRSVLYDFFFLFLLHFGAKVFPPFMLLHISQPSRACPLRLSPCIMSPGAYKTRVEDINIPWI